MDKNDSEVLCSCESLGHKCFVSHVVSDSEGQSIGKKIFVNGLLPGEEALVEITRDKKTFAFGAVKKLVKASSSRVDAPCEYFAECGGCDLQHVDTASQRDLKKNLVENSFNKVLGELPSQGVQLATQDQPEWHYRNRIQLQFDRAGNFGFFQKSSHELIAIQKCLVADDLLNEFLGKLSSVKREELQRIKRMDCIVSEGEVYLVATLRAALKTSISEGFASLLSICPNILLRYKGKEHARDATIKQSLASFSQVNNVANDVLKESVLELIEGDELTELYAGAGNFSVELSKERSVEITAVELDPKLVQAGREVVSKSELLGKVTFIEQDAVQYVLENKIANTLLLDPPRAGALEVVRNLPNNVSSVVYVSCYLPSLLRDLKILTDSGFRVIQTKIVDMFPQTYHVETVTLLKKAPH